MAGTRRCRNTVPIQSGIPRSRFIPDPLSAYTERCEERHVSSRPETQDDMKLAERMRLGFQQATDDVVYLRKHIDELHDYNRALVDKINAIITALGDVDDVLSRRLNEILLSDTLANRPAFGVTDRLFVANDQAAGSNAFWDSGSAWVTL